MSAPGSSSTNYPPSQTLYISNLDDRKNPEKLKLALQEVCTPFGEVKDIIAMKSLKRRGQAWVVYQNIESAKEALVSLQKFPLYDKPMKIDFAKTKSDVVSKADGTFVPRARNRLKEDPTKRKKDEGKVKDLTPSLPTELAQMQNQMTAMFGTAPTPQLMQQTITKMKTMGLPVPPQMLLMIKSMNNPQQALIQQQQATALAASQAAIPTGPILPNPTLFVQNLPMEANEGQLRLLFGQYAGFREVRWIPGRNCAFVEFMSEINATAALRAMGNFEVRPGIRMELGYARK